MTTQHDYPSVKCNVNSCAHWMTGDYCTAKNIDIMHEEEGRISQQIEQTMCKTFHEYRNIVNMVGALDNVNWGGTMSKLFMGGSVTPSISCTVSSCTYWKEGNLCTAQGILVSGMSANECQDTNCETFRNRYQ